MSLLNNFISEIKLKFSKELRNIPEKEGLDALIYGIECNRIKLGDKSIGILSLSDKTSMELCFIDRTRDKINNIKIKYISEITFNKTSENLKNYKSDCITADKIDKIQHFTKPAPRYTESSLIKEMESLGIGRPSTYATIVQTIKDRDYVVLKDKKFEPTEIGIETTDKLQEFFSGIVNVEYTANMESDLDKIAEAKEDNIKVLHDFYDAFAPLVDKAFHEMEKNVRSPSCSKDGYLFSCHNSTPPSLSNLRNKLYQKTLITGSIYLILKEF